MVTSRANGAIERIVSGQPASQKDTDSDDGETLGDSDTEDDADDYDLDDPFIDDSEATTEAGGNASAANGDNASDNSRPRRRIRLA